MRNISAAAVLAALVATSQCFAQDADTANDREKAALTLQQAMGGETALMRAFATLRPTLIKLLTQSGHFSLSRAAEMVDTVEIPELQKHVPDMLASKARIYAKYFTVHDLQVMTAFYQSPTGQKALANQGAMAAESLSSLQPFIRDVQVHAAALAKKQAAQSGH